MNIPRQGCWWSSFKTRTRPYYFYDALQKEKQLEIVQKDSLYIAKIVFLADRVMGHKPRNVWSAGDFDDLAIWDFAIPAQAQHTAV